MYPRLPACASLALCLSCALHHDKPPLPSSPEVLRATAGAGYHPPPRSKEAGCVSRGSLPDPACTPGEVMTSDLDVICHQSTKDRRKVKDDDHREAFTEYGVVDPESGAYAVDHLIPLALGGDNTIANLWAEAAQPAPGYHEKDSVEDYLHDQVCGGQMDLVEAQRAIATDWVAIYRRLEGPLLGPREERGGD